MSFDARVFRPGPRKLAQVNVILHRRIDAEEFQGVALKAPTVFLGGASSTFAGAVGARGSGAIDRQVLQHHKTVHAFSLEEKPTNDKCPRYDESSLWTVEP